jgi:hypothetical protein
VLNDANIDRVHAAAMAALTKACSGQHGCIDVRMHASMTTHYVCLRPVL